MDPDQWDAVLVVNLPGTFNVPRLAIPHLKKLDAGVILIVSSVGGRFGYPNRSPYATTKRGLYGLTETLAIELGDAGIRVKAITPGAVAGDRGQRVLKAEPLHRAQHRGIIADALSLQSIKRFVDRTTSPSSRCFSPPTVPNRSLTGGSTSTVVTGPPSS